MNITLMRFVQFLGIVDNANGTDDKSLSILNYANGPGKKNKLKIILCKYKLKVCKYKDDDRICIFYELEFNNLLFQSIVKYSQEIMCRSE